MDPQLASSPPAPVLVTGGTGTLGRLVVARLRAEGRFVRVLSRGHHKRTQLEGVEYSVADLNTGEGVEAALRGVLVVVHLAGTARGDDRKTGNLVRAAAGTGVRHLVYISVVGADRVVIRSRIDQAMFGYFESKLAAERVVEQSGIPWTTLRATQFQDSMLSVIRAMARLPIVPVPAGFRFQPVDTGEVADRLVELALAEPAGHVPDLAGPKAYAMVDLVRSYLRAAGKRRLLIPAPLFGSAANLVKRGANLPMSGAVGRRTWEEFLVENVTRGGSASRPPDRVPLDS